MKKMSIISLALVLVASFAGISEAKTPRPPKVYPSVQGDWDITGTIAMTARIKGRSATQRERFDDYFSFNPAGYFDMTDLSGTWTQEGSKVRILLDEAQLRVYFEDYLGTYFGDVGIEFTRLDFHGSIKTTKNGDVISGKIIVNMTIDLYDYGLNGRLNSKTTFKGGRSDSGYLLLDEDLGDNADNEDPAYSLQEALLSFCLDLLDGR